jgi:hypothetical protein
MPYLTHPDYLPIPRGAMGTLFDPERLKKGYVTQEIGDGVHYVTSGGYDPMFVQTGNGVIVVQPARRNADPGTPRPSVSRDADPTKPLLC